MRTVQYFALAILSALALAPAVHAKQQKTAAIQKLPAFTVDRAILPIHGLKYPPITELVVRNAKARTSATMAKRR